MPDSTVHHHRYSNGLTLVAEAMPHVRSAAFNLLMPAGSAYDRPGAFGSATMLAEWITRGAGDRDSRALLSALDNLGVSHGEGAQTVHSSISAATLGRNLVPALEIFADVVLRPHLDDDEVEPIRALAIQNLQSLEDDPGSKVIYELRRRHFPDPWGRPSIGTLADVERITPDDLRAFHQAHYQPADAILSVAGAIEWDQLRDAVGRLFEGWEPRPTPTFGSGPTGPRRDHIAKETQQTQVALAFPTVTVTDPEYYQARAMVGVLGGYSSARLFTEVREKRGLCYSVYASYEGFKHDAAVVCYAGTSSDRAQETLDVTLDEIRKLGRDGLDAEELDTMRAGLKSSLIMQQESSMSRAGSLSSDWYYFGRVRPLDEIAAGLDALTPESVGDFARRHAPQAMTVLTLGPAPLQLPPEA